ncbi:MAG: hypothetical protein HOO67_07115 [Candidatus Peribacteraceae bacterium]|nr:hypothetical protein [Candidatus Peribacteraceae bacterium]
MYGLALAQDMYRDTARKTRGQKFSTVAKNLKSKADALESRVGDEQDVQNDVADTLGDLSGDTREQVDQVFEGDPAAVKTIKETVTHLRQGAEDILATTEHADMENKEHGGETLAEAQLEVTGSETGDAEKMAGKNTVVDKDVGVGAAAHETEHAEKQAVQTVDRVSATPNAVEQTTVSNTLDEAPKKDEMTSTQLTEAGAVAVQIQAAPGSKETLDTIYKDTYEHVRSVVGSDQRVIELARQKDGLEQVGEMMAV